jgi:hypothetical protein
MCLRLPVVERPHAGERSRVRPVGIGGNWLCGIQVRGNGRNAGGRVGRWTRVCHGLTAGPGCRLRVGHVGKAWRAAVVLRVSLRVVGAVGAEGVEGSSRRVAVRAGVDRQGGFNSDLRVANARTVHAPRFDGGIGTAADGGRVAGLWPPTWLCVVWNPSLLLLLMLLLLFPWLLRVLGMVQAMLLLNNKRVEVWLLHTRLKGSRVQRRLQSQRGCCFGGLSHGWGNLIRFFYGATIHDPKKRATRGETRPGAGFPVCGLTCLLLVWLLLSNSNDVQCTNS